MAAWRRRAARRPPATQAPGSCRERAPRQRRQGDAAIHVNEEVMAGTQRPGVAARVGMTACPVLTGPCSTKRCQQPAAGRRPLESPFSGVLCSGATPWERDKAQQQLQRHAPATPACALQGHVRVKNTCAGASKAALRALSSTSSDRESLPCPALVMHATSHLPL
jgi:hypothetical protein